MIQKEIPSESLQPVSNIQLNQLKVEWVPRDSIRNNTYNPNTMTWHERSLLKQSILEDGWTAPIVVLPDRTIVDGEQRWTVSDMDCSPDDIQAVIDKMLKRGEQGAIISDSILSRLRESKDRLTQSIANGARPCIAAITGGLVPITIIDLGDDAHKMIATIRHNRARGVHRLDSMASITNDLIALGLDFDDLETRLGMDDEEIRRFQKAAETQIEALEAELESTDFSTAWEPRHVSELSPDTQVAFQKSTEANKAIKAHENKRVEREQTIATQTKEEVAKLEERGVAVTQIEKTEIKERISSQIPVPEKQKPPELKKIVLFVLPDEFEMIHSVLGEEMAVGLVTLCRAQLLLPASEENSEQAMLPS